MDIIITYGEREYITELKIWRGEKLNNEAYNQLCSYLDARGQNEGYLLNFCFNKKSAEAIANAHTGWFEHNGKKIYSAVAAFYK